MIEILVKDNSPEEFDKAVKLLKKKVNNEGFLREIMKNRYYEKKSDKIRREKRESERMRGKNNG
jgi:small subunit ribosomal protein S21